MCAEVAQRCWLLSDERENSVEQRSICDEPPISAQESKITEQRTAPEFSLREDMKTPTVLFGEASCDGEFSLNVRLGQLVERFDFDESHSAVATLHQKIRHNVRTPPRSWWPRRVVL